MYSPKINKMTEYHFAEFKPGESKRDRVWLIIAPRGSGKSVLLLDLLYKTSKHYDFGVGMTATAETADCFKRLLPADLIYSNGYNYEAGDNFLEVCKELSDQKKERHGVMILDDCMFDSKVMKSKTQQNLHLNGRHYNTTLFNTTQYAMIIPPIIRSNIDYVLCLQDLKLSNKRRLYEMFFGLFPTFQEFNMVFSNVTRDFGCLVLDNTTSSGKIEDAIKWYRASPKTPQFRIGKNAFFKLSSYTKKKSDESKKSTAKAQVEKLIVNTTKIPG
jgi:hypothetical protein